jgi:3-phosphoshikimate 1-carboxyvinyltransferase
MKKLVKPSGISGGHLAPASKSMMQRAIAIAALAKGDSVLRNYTACNDSEAALEIASRLGSKVKLSGSDVFISGGFAPTGQPLDCGEAGLGIRMFTPIASLSHTQLELNGHGSLKTRPVTMLEKPLQELGASIITNGGYVPIKVTGPLKGGKAFVDGSVSSQMLTGMLIALPMAETDTVLVVKDLKSKPYIDMTIEIMLAFGAKASHSNYQEFHVPGRQQYLAADYSVEGDWSGASFPLAAAAIAGSARITNLRRSSKQADMAFLQALQLAGAAVVQGDDFVEVTKCRLEAFCFDANECPDLFPPLVALAANCIGTTVLKGVGRLKHKESDRATVLKNMFSQLGICVTISGDEMSVAGGQITGGCIHAHYDHRIAMAAAVAALNASGPIEIDNAECVAKSYPGFYDDFCKLGAIVENV